MHYCSSPMTLTLQLSAQENYSQKVHTLVRECGKLSCLLSRGGLVCNPNWNFIIILK